jgi:tRNA isopentenyl-2-thiomethyl-A-37 hydroxylase MiaE
MRLHTCKRVHEHKTWTSPKKRKLARVGLLASEARHYMYWYKRAVYEEEDTEGTRGQRLHCFG